MAQASSNAKTILDIPMRRLFPLLLLSIATSAAFAADKASGTCDQIRAQIGTLPPGNHNLLRRLAMRKDCGFTADDIYKAAYGNKPRPPVRSEIREQRNEDDDD